MSFLWNVVTASVVGRKKTCDREAFLVSCRRVKISATNSIFKFLLILLFLQNKLSINC